MTRGVVVIATAAALWCAFVIAATFRHGPPPSALAVYIPAVLVLPVLLHTLWRTGKDALLAMALVPRPLLVLGLLVALFGWLFAFGALHGQPGSERVCTFAGVVLVLHAVFGIIAMGLVKVDENPHLR
ncbi:hypothetical protein [Umezawaea sp. Da 62-37]|uniref:hypothetical protein n=1 Tax=Umezawaea sp. Da 62-37 TaxID=3075927 RepID=UPI0028F7436B|nr:hypothetical protein [Umezawaea sp. Da 62-37]WNV83437.1 hypothetical protein RM788_35390 [Umezawaea sp. Da 62-37]